MVRKVERVVIGPDTDLRRILDDVSRDGVPRMLEENGKALAVVARPEDVPGDTSEAPKKAEKEQKIRLIREGEDIWAGYDAEKVRAAILTAAGALEGVDRDQLLRDIREGRGHDPDEAE